MYENIFLILYQNTKNVQFWSTSTCKLYTECLKLKKPTRQFKTNVCKNVPHFTQNLIVK